MVTSYSPKGKQAMGNGSQQHYFFPNEKVFCSCRFLKRLKTGERLKMKTSQITKLKKDYPENNYSIRENQGTMIISPRKRVIRIYKYQAEQLAKEDLTKALEKIVEKTTLTAKDFETKQVTITEALNRKLLDLSRKCRARRVILVQRLIEEGLQ